MISIAMATYNGEKYLREQLDSILLQTISDWELIICDDCSVDNTFSILEEYKKKDDRVHIFRNDYNLGFKKNFEKAIALCSGEYVAFSDQDDIWEKNHLMFLLNNIGSCDIAFGNALYVNKKNEGLNVTFTQKVKLDFLPEKEKVILRLFLVSNFVQGASMLLKASFAKKFIPIPEKIEYHDEWFALNSCFGNGLIYVNEIITRYRQHGGNVTMCLTHISPLKKLKDIFIYHTGIQTDRFDYLSELNTIHPNYKSEEWVFINNFMCSLKKISIKRLFFLWKNFESICTTRGHKGFIKRLVVWRNWVRRD